jgi:hypothetical protein
MNLEAQPVSEGLLIETSKIFPKGDSESIFGVDSYPMGEQC